MKRDMDLIRLILLELEEVEEIDMSTYSDDEINYNKRLVVEADLADGTIASSAGGLNPQVFLLRLTWNGHDFLDAARDDTIWKRATEIIGKSVGSTTFDVLKSVLVTFATEAIKQMIS